VLISAICGGVLCALITTDALYESHSVGLALFVVAAPSSWLIYLLGLNPNSPFPIIDNFTFIILINAILGATLLGLIAIIIQYYKTRHDEL